MAGRRRAKAAPSFGRLEHDPESVQRLFLATSAERVCAEIMLNQKPEA
jgi:hypothetical protein